MSQHRIALFSRPKSMKKIAVLAVIFLATSGFSRAKKEAAEPIKLLNTTPPPPPPPPLIEWRTHDLELQLTTTATRMIVAGFLSMAAASISSAGGIGGGGLFIPILTIVAGLDLKAASSFSALMVTGGSIANVVSNVLATKKKNTSLIDYDVALLSEPCMLLGASIGVFCNIIFPEWLITMIFTIFLVWSTFKTFKFGITIWNLESQGINIRCHHHKYLQQQQEEDGRLGITNDISIINPIINTVESDGNLASRDHPLLLQEQEELLVYKVVQVVPWRKLGMLAIIWLSFFLLYLLRGGRYGQGIIPIQSCGVVYWIISAAQIPLAIISTSWILYKRESICNQHQVYNNQNNLLCERKDVPFSSQEVGGDNKKLIFPVMAFLAGVLGGVFGIGGGMLISPFLLQLGTAPGVTAATCSFMVLFSSTMSAFQYILLGMDHIEAAIVFAVACFAGSVIGLVIVQRAIKKHGRASLIVFSVGLVLALSTVLMTSFGVVDVWQDFRNGTYMGFKGPC